MSIDAGTAGRRQAQAGARLGGSLRAVLVHPIAGFEAALRTAERRARAGRRPAEGLAPYILAALGGVAAMATWLKLGGALGRRVVPVGDFRWDFFIAALVGGALISLLSQQLWSALSPLAPRALEHATPRRDLRLVWGAAALPLVAGALFVIPLDLVIVGPEAYATDRLRDGVATAWAAVSIALSVSLTCWSLFLFVRGMQVAGKTTPVRALLVSVGSVAIAASVIAAIAWLLGTIA